ncbi:putative O-linked N-acetylglucosamine transferase, SPINDLY family [Thiorhodovibrio litoralis]|nr:putative O-linked N-acetylglucosamine transferase, SPINDLY family [Thiorhodovibrio litoralis]
MTKPSNQGTSDSPPSPLQQAINHQRAGRLEDAERAYQAILDSDPEQAGAHNNLGNVLRLLGRYEEARLHNARAVALAPENVLMQANYWALLERLGDVPRLREALAAAPICHPGVDLIRARLLRRDGQLKDALAALEQSDLAQIPLEDERLGMWEEIAALRGALHDRLDEPAAAFAAFEAANTAAQSRFARHGIDKAPYNAHLTRLDACLTPAWAADWQTHPAPAQSAVFLVGFPRSGTTLLDTILRSHPAVTVVEEVPCVAHAKLAALRTLKNFPADLATVDAQTLEALQLAYTTALDDALSREPSRPVVVDKLPLNLTAAVLIHRLFPDARFILALRHPCDCVLSCFMHSFAPNEAMANFLTLTDCARLYDRAMRLWVRASEVFPLRVHALRYEDLVVDFTNQVRALLDFLGLPWDDAVTRYAETAAARRHINTPSYHQVVQPLYTHAAGRWQKYRAQLAPVLPWLLPWARHWGYALTPQDETLIETAAPMPAQTFLHIGCGPKRKDQTTAGFNTDDWTEIRFDIDPAVQPDIQGSMTDMAAVESESMDALFSSHNIEHLYPHEVPVALAEFHRILKPEGFAVITCPDIQSVCALVAEDKLTEPAYQSPAGPIAPLDILYGHRPSLAQGNLYMAHKCGFTERVLIGTLQAAGFASIASRRRGAPFFDLWAVASKRVRDEPVLRALAQAHLPA